MRVASANDVPSYMYMKIAMVRGEARASARPRRLRGRERQDWLAEGGRRALVLLPDGRTAIVVAGDAGSN
jgi:hypothetical protein